MPSNSCVAEPFAVHAGSIAQLHGRLGIVRNRCSTFMHRGVGACTPSAAHRPLLEPNVLPRLWTRTRGAGWLRGSTCCTSAGRRQAGHVQQLAVVGSASTRRADGVGWKVSTPVLRCPPPGLTLSWAGQSQRRIAVPIVRWAKGAGVALPTRACDCVVKAADVQ